MGFPHLYSPLYIIWYQRDPKKAHPCARLRRLSHEALKSVNPFGCSLDAEVKKMHQNTF